MFCLYLFFDEIKEMENSMSDVSELFTTTGITDSRRMLHTPGEFAKKNLLYVQEVGQLKSLQPHKSQRENLNSYLFLAVLSGEGTIVIGQKEYKIKRGQCALINCMDYYAHESSKDKPWQLIWIHFNGHTAKDYFQLFMEQNENENIFTPTNIKEIQKMIKTLMEYQEKKDLESELLSGEIIIQLLNICVLEKMQKEPESKDRYKKLCSEIRECINEHYQKENIFQLLIDRYGMEEKELDFCFQKCCGITLKDYILNRRFTAAKELLRFTVKPVKKIIEESGIKNDDLFRKLFQDSEGMTAEDYRMKWSQWLK